MAKTVFSYEDRVKMFMAALEMCPECQDEFKLMAFQRGADVLTLIREEVWRWWGNWPHGLGCPKPVAKVESVKEELKVDATPSIVLRDPEAATLA